MAADVTTIDVVNLVIGMLALIGAVIALVWRFIEWRLTGSIVRVDTRNAVTIAGLPTGDHRAITITAHNIGRTGVAVTGWGLKLPDDTDFVMFIPNANGGPSLPHTLHPGHEASWLIMWDDLRATIEKLGPDTKLRGFVHLGTGARVVSKDVISADRDR